MNDVRWKAHHRWEGTHIETVAYFKGTTGEEKKYEKDRMGRGRKDEL
jgi:hypothetical protein